MRRAFAALLLPILASVLHAAPFQLGVDVLEAEGFAPLEGKKIGLVVHPASVNSRGVSTVDVLRGTPHCRLVALFGPEHGVYGDEYAGVKVGDRTDARTGLPIYSLYGRTRKPTPEMLRSLDALVFDLQDIGSRSYTYISTMKNCLEACAGAGIEFVVLDRPNPLGGRRIEGPMVEKSFESFVSALSVPYLHGMTMGELAQWVRDQVAPDYDKLRVVKMSGWRREMVWDDTGLDWIPTSPHIPYASTCAAYAATGILGELDALSNGVGYTMPFDLAGAPAVKAEALAEALNKFWRAPNAYKAIADGGGLAMLSSPCPKGISFLPTRFKPFYAAFKDKPCQGVQILLNPRQAETLVEINFRILAALDAPKFFRQAAPDTVTMFDKVCGTNEPRKVLMEGRNLGDLFDAWKTACNRFRDARQKFLLYE